MESDGSVRIAWNADGFEAIHVYARFWPSTVAAERAQEVADVALTNRTVHDLRRGLRALFGGTFQLQAPDEDAPDRRVAIFFDPPRGEPNPDEPADGRPRSSIVLDPQRPEPRAVETIEIDHPETPLTDPQLSYCHIVQPRPRPVSGGHVGLSGRRPVRDPQPIAIAREPVRVAEMRLPERRGRIDRRLDPKLRVDLGEPRS